MVCISYIQLQQSELERLVMIETADLTQRPVNRIVSQAFEDPTEGALDLMLHFKTPKHKAGAFVPFFFPPV